MTVKHEFAIQDAASWVLRIGVLTSVSVMLLGLVISFFHGAPSVEQMEALRFNDHPLQLVEGMFHGDGPSTIQVGILLLILTPILRVAVSMILFLVADKDWFYAAVTFVVLLLTLSALILVR